MAVKTAEIKADSTAGRSVDVLVLQMAVRMDYMWAVKLAAEMAG